jgi:hypothetical protein
LRPFAFEPDRGLSEPGLHAVAPWKTGRRRVQPQNDSLAIPTASMMSARLDAMHHFWRQSSDGV